MWKWDQSAGELSHNGATIFKGYSGHGEGMNNPAMQKAVAVGPIPRGHWRFAGIAQDNHTGPFSIIILPVAGTDTCGRSGFRCHGDNAKLDHSASHGCIILPPQVRHQIWDSGDHELEVVE